MLIWLMAPTHQYAVNRQIEGFIEYFFLYLKKKSRDKDDHVSPSFYSISFL